MDFETISYPITAPQRVSGGTEENKSHKPFQITIKVTSASSESSVSIVLTAEQLRSISKKVVYPKRKEEFYLVAINNLLKKSDFLQLSLQHAEKVLTDEEFENELDSNSEKYLIDLHEFSEPSDINVIGDIVNQIERDFTVDEVSEIFSVTPECLKNGLKYNK